jgi:hypothetical protein
MQLIKVVGDRADVQFSIEEILTLNNSLNEICHGVKIIDFETKIGVSREQAKSLLDSVHKLTEELRSKTQNSKNLPKHIDTPNSSLAIKEKCVLETSGYQVIFYLRSLDYSRQSIGLVVLLTVNPDSGGVSVRSTATTIRIENLRSLILYLEQHINNLKEDLNKTSHTFLTYDTTFQVQALSGNYISEDEGSFPLRFMVNVGHHNNQGNPSTYVGAEAVVSFANIRSFTSSLQLVLNKFSYSN